MYLIRPPFPYRWLFPKALFRQESSPSAVYLTFDDGPHPEATPFVLDVLREEQVPATFFLLGKNAEKYPDLHQRIRDEGHAIGNHGQEHISGWRTTSRAYRNNFEQASSLLGQRLLRPPYGRLTPSQYQLLNAMGTVVMWDALSGDFDTSISPEKCVSNTLRTVRNGSIIVMHDSQKALPNLRGSLKPIIQSIKGLGLTFKKL